MNTGKELEKGIKALTSADYKFIKDMFNFDIADIKDTTELYRRNRFGGPKIAVNKVVAACIDFVYEAADGDNINAMIKKYPRLTTGNFYQNFDRARYITMKLDRDAYMDILD
jgi:hypothetical protein